MATLVLNTVGNALGGPIGGLVGAIAGRAIDSQVFGIGNRRIEGKREEDLTLQTSTYGASIPIAYGRNRFAGNIIWSTGLIETREEETQGAKGGPSVTQVSYSYSASFAVSLCAREVQDIGKIWAGGKLIRSSGGDIQVGGTFRLYSGTQDQLPDPLMEGELGLDQTPAHRGLAYVLFENLPLAEFGNALPLLSFEVINDTSVDIIDVASDLLARAKVPYTNSASASATPQGMTVGGLESYRTALETLTQMAPLHFAARGDLLTMSGAAEDSTMSFSLDALGARPAGSAVVPQLDYSYEHALDLPQEVSVIFSNPDTDFQRAAQRAQKPFGAGVTKVDVESYLALDPSTARAMAIDTLNEAWRERRTYTLSAGPQAEVLEPGDQISVTLEDSSILLLDILTKSFGDGVVKLDARLPSTALEVGQAASAGYGYSGETSFSQITAPLVISPRAFELPATPQFGSSATVYAAAPRTSGQGKTVSIYVSTDGGINYESIGSLSTQAVTGTCLTGMPDANPALFQMGATLLVQLDYPDMELVSRPRLAILNGANLVQVGDELLQFETAELQPDGSYLLSGFLRGRAGTQDALIGAGTGQSFTLLRGVDFFSQPLDLSDIGVSVLYKLVPPGKALADVSASSFIPEGKALKPFAPTHLSAFVDGTGAIEVHWIARSREGFAWLDGVDVPIGESALSFQVQYTDGSSVVQKTVGSTQDTLSVLERESSFGTGPVNLTIKICQISATIGVGALAQTTVSFP